MKKYWWVGIGIILVVGLGIIRSMNFNFGGSEDNFREVKQRFVELEARNDLKKVTFAGGCFWCMEGPFEAEEGVEEVLAGYTGGEVVEPSYEEVTRGDTGHREGVMVYYDASKVSYERLLEIYWLQIDPTDEGGQFADRGFQYTTAIYYHDEEQKEIAEKSKREKSESGKYEGEIVTKIEKFENFYPAEDYHQDFYLKSKDRYEQYSLFSGRKKYVEEIKKKFGKGE